MDFVLFMFVIILIGVIIIYARDINNLLIKRILKMNDYIVMLVGSIIIIFLTYKVSESKIHVLIGILGGISFLLSFLRVGITTKGFRSVRGVVKGNFENLDKVILEKNDNIKVIFVSKGIEDIHYYKLKDYDRILKILKKNIENKRIKVV